MAAGILDGAKASREVSLAAVAGVLTVAAVVLVQRGPVRATNFGGADEWLYLDLTSRGVLGIPYANRPLVLLWHALAGRLCTGDLEAFALTTTAYLLATGLLTAALARRLAPGEPLLALLAGTAAAAWAPLDYLRLDTVLIAGYAGFTFAAAAACVSFLESFQRARPLLFLLGALLGLLSALGVESAVPVLAAAPLALLVEGRPAPRTVRWALAWWVLVALAAAAVAMPLLRGTPSYQTGALGLDLHPLRVAGRLAQLLSMQALPLVASDPRELASGWVLAAAVVFVAGALACARWSRMTGTDAGRLVRLLGWSLAFALAGHLALALTRQIRTPARTQMLSAPGFALLFAAAVVLATRRLPRRLQAAAAIAAGAWLVAVGTGRVVAMQAEWDATRSAYPAQRAVLRSLVRAAPSLRPGTLVLLLDDAGAWPFGFSFRHAVRFLYGDEVVGAVVGAEPFLYPHRFVAEGVIVEPWPVIRVEWQVPATLHRWDTIVVARASADGSVGALAAWPEGVLPALPPGARYAPGERVLGDSTRARQRRALDF